MSEVLLDVQQISIAIKKEEVVKASSFHIMPSETLALIGKSGSGKSLTASALIGLLPDKASASGRALWQGKDLLALSEKEWLHVRGREISIVFQNPAETLNPSYKAETQLRNALRLHGLYRGKGQLEELLASVGLEGEGKKYPYELSGGMRQRLSLLIALAPRPKLLIADEITSALDRDQEEKVMSLLMDLKEKEGFSLLLITHDIMLAGRYAERVAVMKDGTVIEEGPVSLLSEPAQPYTRLLVERSRLTPSPKPPVKAPPVLEARGITKKLGGKMVLEDLGFTLFKGERLGIRGPSGIGKTTLLSIISRILEPDSGSLILDGKDFLSLSPRELRGERQKIQLIFQDPGTSLDPRMSVKDIVLEGAKLKGRKDLDALYISLMAQVGLSPELGKRRPSSLSGGEQARVAIARALAMEPEVLVADEITSSLDAPLRKGILDLLSALPLSIIFSSHDTAALSYLCPRTLRLENGRLEEDLSDLP